MDNQIQNLVQKSEQRFAWQKQEEEKVFNDDDREIESDSSISYDNSENKNAIEVVK